MRISTSYLLNNLTRDIAEQLGRMQKLSEQISTGKRVRKPSDDPIAASRGLAIRSLKAGAAQHRVNVDDAKDWLGASERALLKAHDVLAGVADVALRASNGTFSNDEFQAFAQEVDGLISELLGLANTEYDERYIFAGLKTNTKPFLLVTDPMDPAYPVAYQGADGSKEIEVESGTTIRVNTDGEAAFLDLFTILSDLRQHLAAGNASPTFQDDIAGDIEAAQAAQGKIMNLVTGIGAKARRLDRVSSRLAQNEVELEALLSKVEDANVVKAVTELGLQEAVYKAALGAAARVMQPSLLDYLG